MQDDIDIIVTYVNNHDPVWQDEISQFKTEIDWKRYRDWENLKYWFRAVAKNKTFPGKVHLVVAYESQVPEWVNRETVNTVYHRDIIPQELLPTFNSTTIEMFLPKIKGLSEKFLYSNDDMFILREVEEKDFFVDGKPVYELIKRVGCGNTFRRQCVNCYREITKLFNISRKPTHEYFYIKHSIDPMLKTTCDLVWSKIGDKIFSSCTKFREPINFTQYLFPDYDICANNWVSGTYDFAYIKLDNVDAITREVIDAPHKIACFNDSYACEDFDAMKSHLNSLLDSRFPTKCIYEK